MSEVACAGCPEVRAMCEELDDAVQCAECGLWWFPPGRWVFGPDGPARVVCRVCCEPGCDGAVCRHGSRCGEDDCPVCGLPHDGPPDEEFGECQEHGPWPRSAGPDCPACFPGDVPAGQEQAHVQRLAAVGGAGVPEDDYDAAVARSAAWSGYVPQLDAVLVWAPVPGFVDPHGDGDGGVYVEGDDLARWLGGHPGGHWFTVGEADDFVGAPWGDGLVVRLVGGPSALAGGPVGPAEDLALTLLSYVPRGASFVFGPEDVACDFGGHGGDEVGGVPTGWAVVPPGPAHPTGQHELEPSCAVCAATAGYVFVPAPDDDLSADLPPRVQLPDGDHLTLTTVGYLLGGPHGGVSSKDPDAVAGASWLAHRVLVELDGLRWLLKELDIDPDDRLTPDHQTIGEQLSAIEDEAQALENLLTGLSSGGTVGPGGFVS